MNNEIVTYEHPMHERIRNLLRFEHLYTTFDCRLKNDIQKNCRPILESLLQINDLLVRSDIRNEIIKELKRQKDVFNTLRNNSEVDTERVNMINNIIDEKLILLQDQSYHPGSILKNNELMKVFSQRISILGGTCNFDLPRLHYWLKQSEFERKQDLIDWSSDLMPIKDSIYILLENIRKSSTSTHEDAESGFYHKQIGVNISCQLIRVNISSISPYYPDISGVKHRFTIRFMKGVDSNARPIQTHNDVHFELCCCIL